MLLRKLWRTMGTYKAQFISMIIMIALGIGIFIGFNIEWYSLEKNTDSFLRETNFADYRIVSESGFSADDVQNVLSVDGVKAASRFISVNADVKERDGDSIALTVTENPDVSSFITVDGDGYDPDSTDGIWVSKKYADANGIAVGDTLTFVYRNAEITGKVCGLIRAGEYLICVRDETQLMPDPDTYSFAYISPAMMKDALGFEFYPQINVISDTEKKDFCERIDSAFGKTMLILSKDENISYSGASGEAEEGKTMSTVLPVMFLLIAVLTMVTTMHRLAAKEKTQIGTLKALGFKNRRILAHYTSYALMIGLIGSALGIALGFGVAYFIMNPSGSMGTYLDMPSWKLSLPWFCWIVLVGIIALLTVIGFLSVRKMLAGCAADSLRPYTPKKVKPLRIEKTAFFHRLGFGIRWNLRDIMRHKSRTLMTLIGIVGCMIIAVGSVGMRDTMNEFLDVYYDGATNYASRIYLSEDATDEERSALCEKYGGDTSASVSVQLEEKALSLDIYKITHDTVRFPSAKKGYTSLENDGAYICMRIADEFDLAAGDTFTVSPYGSDEKYSMKVNGIIQSVSESIVITDEYAESLGIPRTVDSVYTPVQKAEIPSDGAIKSVQSKQAIIDSFDTFTEIMDLMIFVLIFAAVILCTVVLYNLGVMSYAERYREMATLKVVGFKDKKIAKLLISQNLWITFVGVLIGLPGGYLTLSVLMKLLASEYEMRTVIGPLTYAVSIILTFGVSLAVSVMIAAKNKKIDMVEALKGAE